MIKALILKSTSDDLRMRPCYTVISAVSSARKVFLTTLIKASQQWFNQLEPSTITFFQDFSEVFLHQFTCRKKHKNATLSLFDVKRRKRKSLREFVKRFNAITLEILTYHDEVQISTFTQ